MSNGKIVITFDGSSDLVPVLHKIIGKPAPLLPGAPAEWVLVKGYHDSCTIDDVFGPYTEEHANWLLRNMLDCSPNNWTMVKLSSGPEAEPS